MDKIHTKYTKEYGSFQDHHFDDGAKIFLSNQHVESVFGHLKNKKVDSNTTTEQLISRTELVFNDILSWILNENDCDEILKEASKSKKSNREKSIRRSLDYQEDLYDFLIEN